MTADLLLRTTTRSDMNPGTKQVRTRAAGVGGEGQGQKRVGPGGGKRVQYTICHFVTEETLKIGERALLFPLFNGIMENGCLSARPVRKAGIESVLPCSRRIVKSSSRTTPTAMNMDSRPCSTRNQFIAGAAHSRGSPALKTDGQHGTSNRYSRTYGESKASCCAVRLKHAWMRRWSCATRACPTPVLQSRFGQAAWRAKKRVLLLNKSGSGDRSCHQRVAELYFRARHRCRLRWQQRLHRQSEGRAGGH